MSTQTPSIKSVLDDVVEIALPSIEGNPSTHLTAPIAALGTSQTFADNSGLTDGDYLILGDTGGETTEIVKINAVVVYGTAVTTSACVFPHGYGTKVTLIRFNQVAIYGSDTADDIAPTLIDTINIDVAHGFNVIKVSTAYDYYYARYYHEETTTYSPYSDPVASSGLTPNSRGEIKKEFLSMFNEQIDDLITDDWLNRSINRWQRELSKRRKYWSVLIGTEVTDMVEDQEAYDLPSDIQDKSRDSIISVKAYNQPILTKIDQTIYNTLTYDSIGSGLATAIGLADVTVDVDDASDFTDAGSIHIEGDSIAYTGITANQLTGVTGITATHVVGLEVWHISNKGQPVKFLVDTETYQIKLWPIPNSNYDGRNLYVEYWRKFVDLINDADTTLFNWPEDCYLYLNWQLAIRRKLSTDEILTRKAEWINDLENLVVSDPDYKEIRIGPRDIYTNPY